LGRRPPNEWELSNFGFNGKKRNKISAITAYATPERYGSVGGLSTPTGSRRAVKEFMIFTEFSRSQGTLFGRVSAPLSAIPKAVKDFP
jgi:hypothetical protein